jgi:3-hydroxyisobutyrate dehydrogenase-like beta-hydroxyacid dehydrogenase
MAVRRDQAATYGRSQRPRSLLPGCFDQQLGAFAEAHGVAYLDGAILTFPSRIGDQMTMIAYAGSRAAFDAHAATLRTLGGRSAFVSEEVGGARAVDLAWLSFLYGNAIGLLQGAAFCESQRVDPAQFFDAVPSLLVEIAGEAAYHRQLIGRGDYGGDQATLDVHVAAMRYIAQAAEAASMPSSRG